MSVFRSTVRHAAGRVLRVGLLLAIAVPTAATAQFAKETQTGSRVQAPAPAAIKSNKVDPEGIGVMREFARCTYAKNRLAVANAVALAPGEDLAALAKLADGGCLYAGEMRFQGPLFRGALYSELYRQRTNAHGKWSLPVSAFDPALVPPADAPGAARTHHFMLDLAACVHEAVPQAVSDVVVEPFGSDSYDAAFAAVIPQLGPCLPEGLTVKLNHMTLEHAFGEFLYRRQAGQPDSTGAEG